MIDDFLLVDGGDFREDAVPRPARGRALSGPQPGRERRRHQGAGRGQRGGRAGARPRRRALRLGSGARLHAARDGQCRGERAPRHRPAARRRVRLRHGRRLAARRRAFGGPRGAARDGRFHRHRPAAAGQFQCAAGGDARRRAVRVPLPGRRRHPAQRRLPQADRHRDPARHVPLAASGRGRGRGQYRGVAGGVLRAVRRGRRARLLPGDDEQLPVRRRYAAILRDDLRRRGRRAPISPAPRPCTRT